MEGVYMEIKKLKGYDISGALDLVLNVFML